MLDLLIHRIVTTWPWYLMRASGFAAAGLVIMLMLSGIGHVTGFTYRYLEPIKAWAVHKALAYALLGCIAIHVATVLIDKFVPFSLADVLIPGLNQYNNHSALFGWALGSIAIAAGIFATWGILVIVWSSLTWINTKKHQWRQLHYLSYAVVVAVFLHGLLTGTDLRAGFLRGAWLTIGLLLVAATLIRIWRIHTLTRPSPSHDQYTVE